MSLTPHQQPPDPKARLATAIRGWVHMDNMVERFNQQAANARELRDKHEEDAIQLIKDMKLQNSTIQISGASLQLANRKTPGGLTWGYLEREIPAWATRSGLTPIQAQSLMKWLQDHRGSKESEYLKKNLKEPSA